MGKHCCAGKYEKNLKIEEIAKHLPQATDIGKGLYGARQHSWKIWNQSRRLPLWLCLSILWLKGVLGLTMLLIEVSKMSKMR